MAIRLIHGVCFTVAGCTDSIHGWLERRLHHTASFVHPLTGPAPQADRVHDKALSLIGEAATVRRCQIDMHRAIRLVRDGHVTEGVTHAATSLQSVPPQRQGTFVRIRSSCRGPSSCACSGTRLMQFGHLDGDAELPPTKTSTAERRAAA